MFENIDVKLKVVAYVQCILGIIGSVIFGIILITEELIGIGLLVVAYGSFMSWLSSLGIYGLGEAVEKATLAAQRAQHAPTSTISNTHAELLSKLQQREQQEEIKEKKLQQEERRQQLSQDETERIDFFLNEISSCDSFFEINKIWENYPEDTFRNAEEISKKIASMVKFERIYGQDKHTISAFLTEIKEELLR